MKHQTRYVLNPPVEENTDPRYITPTGEVTALGEIDTSVGLKIPGWMVGLAAIGIWWKYAKKK